MFLIPRSSDVTFSFRLGKTVSPFFIKMSKAKIDSPAIKFQLLILQYLAHNYYWFNGENNSTENHSRTFLIDKFYTVVIQFYVGKKGAGYN